MLSKIEKIARQVFCLYDRVEYNVRPDWLVNPRTGKNLEIDIYFPDKKVGIEVNSAFHEIRYQKLKDKFKQDKCAELGIKLYTIDHPYQIYGVAKELGVGITSMMKSKIHRYVNFKPKKKTRLGKILKYKQHIDEISDIYDKERKLNLDRMLLRGRIDKKYYDNALLKIKLSQTL